MYNNIILCYIIVQTYMRVRGGPQTFRQLYRMVNWRRVPRPRIRRRSILDMTIPTMNLLFIYSTMQFFSYQRFFLFFFVFANN